MATKLKAALLCFLLLASAAVAVILWPQPDPHSSSSSPSTIPASPYTASAASSNPQPAQDFSPQYSSGQAAAARSDDPVTEVDPVHAGSSSSSTCGSISPNDSAESRPAGAQTIASQSSPAQAAESQSAPAIPASLNLIPTAFAPPDPKDFTPDQMAAIGSLRQEFTDNLQAAQLDPNDPLYLQRWQELESNMDDEFRAKFGTEAYNKYQAIAGYIAGHMNGPQ